MASSVMQQCPKRPGNVYDERSAVFGGAQQFTANARLQRAHGSGANSEDSCYLVVRQTLGAQAETIELSNREICFELETGLGLHHPGFRIPGSVPRV